MSRYNGEEILVIPRSLFDSIGSFQGISTDTESYISELINPEKNFFMDREAAEDDPSHKQLIPYCIFRHGDRYLHYTRGKSGGESRLHAAVSVGIGGHINPIDAGEQHQGYATYVAGVAREIEEELDIQGGFSQKIVAILNDDSNEVGKVHLGVVHLFELETDQVTSNEDSLANLGFVTLDELKGDLYDRLETWSKFCVDHVEDF